MSTLAVLGGGRMGSALVGGLIRAGTYAPSSITVVDPESSARDAVSAAFGVSVSPVPVAADDVVIAVKPAELERACGQLAAVGCGRVVSIVAGAPTATIERYLGAGVRVIRSMPNTPAVIGAGATAIAAGLSAGPEDLAWAETVLGSVGIVVTVPEKLIDAVTGLSGSGPAYVFLIAEALIDAGVHSGLDRVTATTLAAATLRGASELLVTSGESPSALRAQVTSPGGTTAAGLRVLEQRSVRGALIDAVAAATERSRELGGS